MQPVRKEATPKTALNAGAVSRKLGRISPLLASLGALALFAMMCLTVTDVVGRYLFNSPVLGAFELTEYLVLIVIFSFLAFTQAGSAHVSVDLVVTRFSPKTRLYVALFNHTLCLLLMALIAWMGFQKALDLKGTGEISPNLAIPEYPFAFFLVFGCVVMCIEYIRDLLRLFTSRRERSES
jgi:TRAP-type C4-dicarboxylate transport system permease small subunit